ncbi:hypothetical protein B0537_05355 [Desulforamulus ferrireducens]|uniref:Uncharacterized protein n=2 Tax=Desulforamulus ferrireducens TaxID=1833852 RepID=A0A1S6IUY3_9FIRM|nr:hypothetical protein B0537_05355 [Desulforamulus ferrireducens]
MFCYTYLNNIECALRELTFWTKISSEHPIFLQNVANCLNLTITPNLLAGLNRMHQCFTALHQEAQRLLGMATGQNNFHLAQDTVRLMQQFLQYDQEFINILQHLAQIGQNQPVWQALVNHILGEQEYMYRLVASLCQQMFHMGQQPNMYPNMGTGMGSGMGPNMIY